MLINYSVYILNQLFRVAADYLSIFWSEMGRSDFGNLINKGFKISIKSAKLFS
jgi:hypothetical protein